MQLCKVNIPQGNSHGQVPSKLWRASGTGGFPSGSVVKNLPANEEDTSLIPRSERCPGEGNGSPPQYSCLGNPMDRRAWQATAHGVTKERHDLVTEEQQQQPGSGVQLWRGHGRPRVETRKWRWSLALCAILREENHTRKKEFHFSSSFSWPYYGI